MAQSRLKLVGQREKLHRLTQNILSNRGAALNIKREQLQSLVRLKLERERLRLTSFRELTLSQRPDKILGLGFAIVRNKDKAIKSVAEIEVGSHIDVKMYDGRLRARVEEITAEKREITNE